MNKQEEVRNMTRRVERTMGPLDNGDIKNTAQVLKELHAFLLELKVS